jgi:hypothetical protein
MNFQVNFKYFNENGQVRGSSIVVEAKDTAEARKTGLAKINTTHDNAKITSVKIWS